ncbi:hypothetical protein [Acinetobacter baumannii]|uniref:hypothetical protein n=1 Tax=Acinetobacter baumannii TaxID=470 RepID=UPI003215463C
MAVVKLRAFEIVNNSINKKHSDLGKKLNIKLKDSISVSERRMRLSTDDPQQEEDLICDFSENIGLDVFCTMLRVALGNNVQHVNRTLFSKQNFTINELNTNAVDAEAIYKHHFYFAVGNGFLVTNLGGTFTITRLQTYLNWLLNEMYEVNPLVSNDILPDLSQIKNITVHDSVLGKSPSSREMTKQKSSFNLGAIARDLIFDSISDTKGLTRHELDQMISAKLVIEFRKPKKDDSDEVKKAFSALLKPISDLDNFEFQTRNKRKLVKGKDVLRIKEVIIDTTESQQLSEQHLAQEMATFILELANERKASPD